MKKATFSSHVNAFRIEAMALLRFQLAFDRIAEFRDFDIIGRTEWVDRVIALKAIENDMIIRICKLDDDTKGVHSFKKAIHEIPDSHKNIIEIEKKIKIFSKGIDKVKKGRRHTQLAHLQIGNKDDQFEPCYNFKPVINLILEIIDLMNENVTDYNWKDGGTEKYELRQEVFKRKNKRNQI